MSVKDPPEIVFRLCGKKNVNDVATEINLGKYLFVLFLYLYLVTQYSISFFT